MTALVVAIGATGLPGPADAVTAVAGVCTFTFTLSSTSVTLLSTTVSWTIGNGMGGNGTGDCTGTNAASTTWTYAGAISGTLTQTTVTVTLTTGTNAPAGCAAGLLTGPVSVDISPAFGGEVATTARATLVGAVLVLAVVREVDPKLVGIGVFADTTAVASATNCVPPGAGVTSSTWTGALVFAHAAA